MDALQTLHRQGFTARVKALEAAERRLGKDRSQAIEAIHRIVHSLYISGDADNDPEVKETILAVQESPDEDLPARLQDLLSKLRAITTAVEGNAKKVCILLVEDNSFIAQALKKHLEDAHREILIAATGAEAEKIIDERDISLVLLDIMLPDADGRNFLLLLRERYAPPSLPIVVVSSKREPAVQAECFALGADAYFPKPVDPATLSMALASYLQRTADFIKRSSRDHLTGLPNREAFSQGFARAAALSSRTKNPLALAILDIDRFKTVNDLYGHSTGDQVLRRISDIISQSLRASDLIARWGGEEFVVLFLNTDLPGARLALNNALAALEKELFEEASGKNFHVTFSAGIAQVKEGATVEQTITQADRFLYRAKALGRSRVLTEIDKAATQKMKILLIEDDEPTAKTVRRHLEGIGLSVLHASDSLKATELISQFPIDMMVIDANFWGADGFELLESLRHSPSLNEIPVVLLTTAGNPEDVLRGFVAGADGCIQKPISQQELLTCVRQLLA